MAQSNGDELAKYLLASYSLSAGEANHLAHFIEQDRKQHELDAAIKEVEDFKCDWSGLEWKNKRLAELKAEREAL